ncbi:MAG: pentapeptide repeat-containing protein [Crocinitomicaceae bacterium]
MQSEITIFTNEGEPRFQIKPYRSTNALPSWNEIFLEVTSTNPDNAKNLDLVNHIDEAVSAVGIDFSKTNFTSNNLERSSFKECILQDCTFTPTNFHHYADREDRLDRSMGTLFIDCDFSNSKFYNCDFVMSKFINCNFNNCTFNECDFRNVTWFDKFTHPATSWESIPELPDPFKNTSLIKCRFGHPLQNAISIPTQLMIPKSYESIWKHMSITNRKLTKFSYLMNETPSGQFESTI